MLQRPEIGSKEHILLWLASQPLEKTFIWSDADGCACAQYANQFGADWRDWDKSPEALYRPDFYHGGDSLNSIAFRLPKGRDERGYATATFGQLYEAARAAWQGSVVS